MNSSLKDLGRPRRLLTVAMLCAIPVLVCGCAEDAIPSCGDLFEAGEFEQAVAQCESEFNQTGDAEAGSAAAQSAFYVGQNDEVLVWLERLTGTSEEAVVLGFAAAVYRRQGQPALGREANERSIELYRQAGDHSAASRTYYTLFRVAWNDSDFRRALDSLRLTSEEAAEADDGEMQVLAVSGLVSLLVTVGDLAGAERALDSAGELVPEDNREAQSYLETWRGVIESGNGHGLLALDAFQRALQMSEGSEDPSLLRRAHLNLVEANVRFGDVDRAMEHLDAARQYAESEGFSEMALLHFEAMVENDRGHYAAAAVAAQASLALDPPPDAAWETECQLGLAEEGLGQTQAAAEAFTRAIGHVEAMRGSLGLDDLKSWLVDEKRQPYEDLFLVQARSGQTMEALGTIERAKARTFLDALVKSTSGVDTASEGLWTYEETAERFQILTALLPQMSESPAVALRPVRLLLESLGSQVFLVYFEAGEELWLASSAGGRVQLHLLGAPSAAVGDLVDRFRAQPDDMQIAGELGALLFPEGSLPAEGSDLHLVVDGALGGLPFAALRRKGRALVSDYVMTYVPSLNTLVAINEGRGRGNEPPVVLGDPHGDLRAAAREAETVAGYLGVSPHTGSSATREQLTQAARARLLHLSTHTGLRSTGPWLALADGDVGATALIQGNIGPRLVVLATCASGAREGRGMWGSLGAAFLAAGSEAVLASLWSIEDVVARDLVNRFYSEGGTTDSATALAHAQRSLIAEGKPASYWGPFVHFGSSRSSGRGQ